MENALQHIEVLIDYIAFKERSVFRKGGYEF